MRLPQVLASTLLVASYVCAHGDGHDHERERVERRRFLEIHTNNLGHCASMHRAGGLEQRAMHRRAELAGRLAESALKSEIHFQCENVLGWLTYTLFSSKRAPGSWCFQVSQVEQGF